MFKRVSQRFFNPRPAPPAPNEESHPQEEQYGVAFSHDNNPEQQEHADIHQAHGDSSQSHSHSHSHSHGGPEGEVMAGSSLQHEQYALQQQHEGYDDDGRGILRDQGKSTVGHEGRDVGEDLGVLKRRQEEERLRRISIANAMPRNRLPTLAEVLARRTLPPVDLYCFYLFMQREGSEDALDFWLDVQQHENLCRAFFKDLRRSGRSLQDDWPGYYREARTRGSIYGPVTGIEDAESDSQHDEKMLQTEDRSESMMGGYGRASDGEWHLPAPGQPRFPGDPDFANRYRHSAASSERAERKNALFKRGSFAPTVLPRTEAITRTDLVASAERIYARYLLPGSEKEIYLPPQLRINSFPLSSSQLPDMKDENQQMALARVPDMFHAQKEYVFRTMEVDVFPRFLRARAFGNLTPISALVRLTLGLLALWAGLATGFAFIFLDVYRRKRLWVILPFAIAVLLIVSHQYELDPLLAIVQQSETTPFHLITVREPYVRKLLLQRAVGVIFLVALITAALTVLFVFVPGHRL